MIITEEQIRNGRMNKERFTCESFGLKFRNLYPNLSESIRK